MADEGGFQEKTEEATPKKRQTAREEGQVAKSMEIPSVFVLLIGVSTIYLFGEFIYTNLTRIMRQSLTFTEVPEFNSSFCLLILSTYCLKFLVILLPVAIAVFVTALVTNLIQVGFYISAKAIQPQFNKLDPIKGFGRILGVKALVEALKAIAKLSIIFSVAYVIVKGSLPSLQLLYDSSVAYILLYTMKTAFKIFIWVLIVMTVVAVLDYLYQRYQFGEQIKMTKQEVKDEYKQTEGDPQVKSRIRNLQYQAAKKRMMQEVPEADVVVTNPTHLALAIKYDPAVMEAPHLVAKGAGQVAERIKKIARENNVPVVENKELARNLYKLVDIGEEIPAEFFKAVAEVLAYVYKMKGKSVG